MEPALRLQGVRKTFGTATAVADLDLTVPPGALYGVIGPNGAGKTTTIRLIMSILFPDAGELSILGHRSALEAKDRIGYLPEERGVYKRMKVGAFLTFMGQLKGVDAGALPARVARGLERVGLAGTEKKRCEELSKGMLQKVQFLAAIIHQPDLLILDEPFSGLDPVSARLLRSLVREEHQRGATILLSTHVMAHAEECGHVVMIHRGRKVLDDSVAAIRRRYDPRTIHFEPLEPGADLAPLRALREVERVDAGADSGSVDIHLVDGSDPGIAIRRITEAVTPARIELARPRLEDIFISLVSDGSTPAPGLLAALQDGHAGGDGMKRIGYIAGRDFLATVMTRGFVIGVLFFPGLLALAFTVGPRLLNQPGAVTRGQIAIVDPTASVAAELRTAIRPEAIAARRAEAARRVIAAAPAALRDVAQSRAEASNAAIERTAGAVPDLELVSLRADAADPSGLRTAKAWLTDAAPANRHLALIVVHSNALTPPAGQDEYGTYDLFVPPNVDDRLENVLYDCIRDALVGARTRARQLDRGSVETMMRVTRASSITLTKNGERITVGVFNRLLPFAFVGLLLMSVLIGGQGLMTSTVEEKASRVIEVLLSAVSPFELLAGKLLGQMGVALVILGIYIGLAFLMLMSFALFGLLDPALVVYLFVFFVITYLTIGSAMIAVGSAVNEMREAQQLMMPIILVMMVPWMLAEPIARQPNSTFSTMISFIPPVNTFAMLLRMTSSAPPPLWQVWLTIAIGAGGVVVALWCAARVFTIGLLMYGKPPDVKTLIRWIRQA